MGCKRPFRLWQGFAINKKDAWSFLSTSEGRPCGYWELSSGATGVDEKLPLRLSHGRSLHDTLLTHVHLLMFSLIRSDDKMMTHEVVVLAEVFVFFEEFFLSIDNRKLDV